MQQFNSKMTLAREIWKKFKFKIYIFVKLHLAQQMYKFQVLFQMLYKFKSIPMQFFIQCIYNQSPYISFSVYFVQNASNTDFQVFDSKRKSCEINLHPRASYCVQSTNIQNRQFCLINKNPVCSSV